MVRNAVLIEEESRERGVVAVGAQVKVSSEEGEETYETLVEMTIDLIRELVAGTGGRDRPGLFGRV